MRTAPVLRVQDLQAHVAGQQVVEHVDLEVAATGVTALLGRNGVGKTSTIKAVMGLIGRTGKIELDGRDISTLPTYRIAGLGVGYVPEDREVFSGLTVSENLALAERKGQEHRYDLVYELFPELRERGQQAAGTLSGGQQQMVAIGRALMGHPALLLLDEPSVGIAHRLKAEIFDAIRLIRDKGTAVLMAEQDARSALRIANRVYVLERGKVGREGDAAELSKDDYIRKVYLGVE